VKVKHSVIALNILVETLARFEWLILSWLLKREFSDTNFEIRKPFVKVAIIHIRNNCLQVILAE